MRYSFLFRNLEYDVLSFSTEIGNFQEFPTKSNFVKISEMKTCHPKLDLKSRASKNEISFEKKLEERKT